MCGIHFILDKHSRLDSKPMEAMVAALDFRGPDKPGIETFKIGKSRYFLGANKLNITDSSAYSDQPFINGSSPCVMIFNGEIYNYQDLKNQQLKDGRSFRSASDTEVLFNHLEANGYNGLKELNGMFSIIFLDTSNGNFLAARDKWGMKPLFMYEDDNYLIFSSETKGILASGLVPKKLNGIAAKQYLKYRYVRRPHTFFEGITEFEPNTFSTCTASGKSEAGLIYEQVPFSTSEGFHSNSVIENIDKLLTEALLSHLSTSGATGIFLSGGVDSTLLLAKMHELGIRQVPVFSFVNSEEASKYGTRDYKFARKAAHQFQATYNEVSISRKIIDTLDEHINRMDQPVGDSGALITFLLAKQASKSMRVVLSGAGADELFAGYNRHRAFYYYLKNYKWLKYFKQAGKLSGAALHRLNRPEGRLFKKYFHSIHENPVITWDRMISINEFNTSLEKMWEVSEDHMRQALMDDRNNYLVNDVLAISDRMSMLASMEMRMPFLDLNLTRYVQTIPSEYLIADGQKHILKKLLSMKGGKVYTQRPKEGLGLPFGGWIDKDTTGLWDFISEKGHLVFNFVDPQIIGRMIREHRGAKADHTLALWSVLILSRWLENNFG